MSKDRSEREAHGPGPSGPPPPVAHPALQGAGTYQVTFAGQTPFEVKAAGPEEAVKKAAEGNGVLSWETPPSVVKVEQPAPAARPFGGG
jgi:hypothetical protein